LVLGLFIKIYEEITNLVKIIAIKAPYSREMVSVKKVQMLSERAQMLLYVHRQSCLKSNFQELVLLQHHNEVSLKNQLTA
jgi:hypothetical protein